MSDTTAAAVDTNATTSADTNADTTTNTTMQAQDTAADTSGADDVTTTTDAETSGDTTDTTADDDKSTVGAMPDNWRDLAADGDDDTLKLLKRYGSVKGVAKALREANDKIRSGKAGITDEPMPDPEKEPDKAKAWRKERGIPDDPTGYVLPETVTKLLTDADKPLLTSFTEFAHGKGASPASVELGAAWYAEMAEAKRADRIAADKEAFSTAEEELRKDWGPEYKGNMKLADRYVATIPGVGDNWTEARMPDGTRLGDIPGFVAWASDMGRNQFGDAVFSSSDTDRRHTDRKTEIEGIMKTDMRRYHAENLDKEYLEIMQREEKRRR